MLGEGILFIEEGIKGVQLFIILLSLILCFAYSLNKYTVFYENKIIKHNIIKPLEKEYSYSDIKEGEIGIKWRNRKYPNFYYYIHFNDGYRANISKDIFVNKYNLKGLIKVNDLLLDKDISRNIDKTYLDIYTIDFDEERKDDMYRLFNTMNFSWLKYYVIKTEKLIEGKSGLIENKDKYINKVNKKVIKCTTFTPIILILIITLYIVIPAIIKRSDNRNDIILFSIPIIFSFILINDYRNRLYYKKNIYLKKTILETILILTGIAFLFYFEGFLYYKTSFINFFD